LSTQEIINVPTQIVIPADKTKATRQLVNFNVIKDVYHAYCQSNTNTDMKVSKHGEFLQ